MRYSFRLARKKGYPTQIWWNRPRKSNFANISQKRNCFFKSLDLLSCERTKGDLALDRNTLQTIEKIFVFHSVGESLHKPQIIEIRQIVSRSRSRNQKRRTLRSLKTTTPSLSIKWKLSSRSRKQKRKNRKPIAKLGNEHCEWFILPLLLPTPAMWFSLDRTRRCHKRSANWRKWKRSGSSDSDSVALITPLASPVFYFHWVISALYDPAARLRRRHKWKPTLINPLPLRHSIFLGLYRYSLLL